MSVRDPPDPERHQRRADQGAGDDGADRERAETALDEVDRQQQSNKAIAERAHTARRQVSSMFLRPRGTAIGGSRAYRPCLVRAPRCLSPSATGDEWWRPMPPGASPDALRVQTRRRPASTNTSSASPQVATFATTRPSWL